MADQEILEAGDEGEQPTGSIVPASKLMRIASMTRAMLEEVRHAQLDDAGRARLVEVYERSLSELEDVLSDDLAEELRGIFAPLSGVPSEGELRVAQAQLVGWLEGLFAGIQATLWSQQAAAASQLTEMRQRAIEARSDLPGQYL